MMYKYEYRDPINNDVVNHTIEAKSLKEAQCNLHDWLSSKYPNYKDEYLTIVEL